MGVTAAGLQTDKGRKTLADAALEAANGALNGSITVDEITGTFFSGLIAIGLVVRESDGTVLLEVPRVQLGYGLRDILGGRIVLGSIELRSPHFNLVKRSGRRINLEEVLGLGGAGGGGPTPLIAFSDVTVSDGTLMIRTEADSSDSLRTDVAVSPYLVTAPHGGRASLRHSVSACVDL
jgi:hypothetical protein